MRIRAGDRSRPAPRRFDGVVSLTSILGLGLLVVLGLMFSVAYGSQQITSAATGLHNADESLRAATVVRAQVGLATHMVIVDEAFGTDSGSAIDLSVDEARTALHEMNRGLDSLEGDESLDVISAVDLARSFGSTTDDALDAITEGDAVRARSLSEQHDEEFQSALTALQDVRARLARSVEDSDRLLGRVATVTRFLLAFLVPAAVIFIYRRLLLRQNRQTELETRLESERRLNDAREEFIANASHELRTPLTGIRGFAEILTEDPTIAESETASELLHLIISESQDLTRMVEDLLTTARLDAGALHFDFHDVRIDEVVAETVEPQVRSGFDITWDCEPAVIRADGLRTRQILRNLISNARKYGRGRVEVIGRIEGSTYRCDVIDDGDGVPDELADRLFERFVHKGGRTAVGDSVGLGLAIVYALVQGMGGSVAYDRVDDRTVFTTRLPLSDRGRDVDPGLPGGLVGSGVPRTPIPAER